MHKPSVQRGKEQQQQKGGKKGRDKHVSPSDFLGTEQKKQALANPKTGTAGAPEGDRKQVAKKNWRILNETS